MKKIVLIATAALAALALGSCNKVETVNPDEGVKSVNITINGAHLGTKAQLTPDQSYAASAAVKQLDIYFTTANDAIQYSYRLSADSEYASAWTAIMVNNQTVRFVGLTNVSRVYVVANSPDAILTSGNINQIGADLVNVYGTKESNEILYVGADRSLNPIYNEEAAGVGETIIIDGAEQASQYVNAEVSIRPVISRLEINSIGVETSGTETVQLNEETYTISWTGFTPNLYGIYMSNFYGTMVPTTPSVDALFTTPAGSHISGGVWDVASDEVTVDPKYNVQEVSLYSNWSGSAYADLFAETYNYTSGNNFYYYHQQNASGTCVPFNFLVPFDVEETAQKTTADASFVEAPAFHFQFYFVPDGSYTITVAEADGTPVEEGTDLYNQLTANIQFTSSSDGIYYANMTQFLDTNDSAVTIEPNTIYRMSEVLISPFNLSTATVSEDNYNIIVKVTVLDYNVVDVKPAF